MNWQRFQNPAREPRDEDAEIERDEERGDRQLDIERGDLTAPNPPPATLTRGAAENAPNQAQRSQKAVLAAFKADGWLYSPSSWGAVVSTWLARHDNLPAGWLAQCVRLNRRFLQ